MPARSATTSTSARTRRSGSPPRTVPVEIPTIEDRVDSAAASASLGTSRIGHDSRIGANAVVLADVPPGSTAVGVPARVISGCLPGRGES